MSDSTNFNIIISEMLNAVEGELEAVENGIVQIESQIESYNEEISALEDAGNTSRDELTAYLDSTKVLYFQLMPAYSTGLVYIEYDLLTYGVYNYTTGNLTDWVIWYQPPIVLPDPLPPPVEIYIYEGVGWDGDTIIIDFVDSWAWINDYLTRPLDSGATYGLIPNRDALEGAKSILEADKLKLEESLIELEPYAT